MNYQLYYQPVGKLCRVEVANLDDLCNVKFEVQKLGQKVCKSSWQQQSNNFNNNPTVAA